VTIRRGEIYLVVLDPVVGNEIAKTRPAIVVSNDIGNKYSGTVTVVPLTSRNIDTVYPFEVMLPQHEGNLPKPSKAKTDQIRTLDKRRLVKRIGRLESDRMGQIEEALSIHLAMD
jgi:mRNA interferase MazF